MTGARLRVVDELPPSIHPDPTFIPVSYSSWKSFSLALTIDCPTCPAKATYPCGQIVAGYHAPRLRKAQHRKTKGATR